MSEAVGHGSQFEFGDGGSPTENFTPVPGVLSIEFGSNKVDVVDSTDMGTTGTTRTFVGGLENPGDVTVKLNVQPGNATQTTFLGKKDGAQHNFKAIYPGALRTKAFAGIVTSVDESIQDDKIPSYTVKIQITGPVTVS